MEGRFSAFKSVWKSIGRDILAIDSVRSSTISSKGVSLNILSLNTCAGCGEEYSKFPEDIAQTYKTLLQNSDLENKENFDLFCENLDTPAIYSQHVGELIGQITGSESNNFCLILGHHPLLPQATMRVAPYTELLNGGNTRLALTDQNKPIIYCHGHIHEDPVEVVSQPGNAASQLILISAPEYKDGYNSIEIFYTEKGSAIGVEITPYRTSRGYIREQASIKIPIALHKLSACDEIVFSVYQRITNDYRFAELKSTLETSDIEVEESALEEILRELQWLGVISVSNKKSSRNMWTITRVGF